MTEENEKDHAKKSGWPRRDFLKAAGGALSGSLLGEHEAAAQSSETGTLHVEIRDGASKEVVPAMVCITSLADHKWRTPPDGTTVPPFTVTREFYEGFYTWKAGDVGPVRVTNGDYHDNDIRSLLYKGRSVYPFWQEVAAYFVANPFTIRLPTGKWRLAVAKGLEYLPVYEEFEVAADQSLSREVLMRRWVDMPKRGWYSGDDHVHMVRMTPEQNQFLMAWAQAEDVHVVNTLRMGDHRTTYFEQMGYGKNSRYQQGDYVLASGQEDPRMDIHQQGHAVALNITAPVRDVARYHLYDVVFDGVHAQGGLAGYAHFAWTPMRDPWEPNHDPDTRYGTYAVWDATINVVRNKVDFLEILQFDDLGVDDYYNFLNLGFKLTATAGSDLPWGDTIGEVRTYVYTGEPFTADAWFDGLKAGRAFVSNGPMVELTADKAIPGDELKLAKNAGYRVRARAWAPPSIGSPKLLELVAHGKVIGSAESSDPQKEELKLDLHMKADESRWIAARVTSHNGALAHTSPIYVLADGQSFRNEKELPQIVDKRLKVLDYILTRLHDPKIVAHENFNSDEVTALANEVEEARALYKKMVSPT